MNWSSMREELISRNVARLVELPPYRAMETHPWSVEEAQKFLSVAQADPLFAAFAIVVLYGLRRGEVLGLRWSDVDFEHGQIRIRNQLQRIDGKLVIGPVKTEAGNRNLPLVDLARNVLVGQRERQDGQRVDAGPQWQGTAADAGLAFTTRSGLPIDPDNFLRSFQRICKDHDVRIIRLHDLRHTQATFLMALGVPPKDAQLILGHADVATTQQIYQHSNLERTSEALRRLSVSSAGRSNEQR